MLSSDTAKGKMSWADGPHFGFNVWSVAVRSRKKHMVVKMGDICGLIYLCCPRGPREEVEIQHLE